MIGRALKGGVIRICKGGQAQQPARPLLPQTFEATEAAFLLDRKRFSNTAAPQNMCANPAPRAPPSCTELPPGTTVIYCPHGASRVAETAAVMGQMHNELPWVWQKPLPSTDTSGLGEGRPGRPQQLRCGRVCVWQPCGRARSRVPHQPCRVCSISRCDIPSPVHGWRWNALRRGLRQPNSIPRHVPRRWRLRQCGMRRHTLARCIQALARAECLRRQ